MKYADYSKRGNPLDRVRKGSTKAPGGRRKAAQTASLLSSKSAPLWAEDLWDTFDPATAQVPHAGLCSACHAN